MSDGGESNTNAYGSPRAAASRAWEQASRVNAFWRTRPSVWQRILVGILALIAIGVLTIGAVAAMIVGAFVIIVFWIVGIVQAVLDRLRGVSRGAQRGPDSDLRKNVRVMGPRE